jgi:nucleotide-binding universal stress UspA family protein
MEPYEPRLIVVPTDFSEPAAHALRYASALGERFGAHLLVIYSDPCIPAIDFTASAAGVFDFARDATADHARDELQAHAKQNIGARVPFDLRLMIGAPVTSILDQVRESGADLIVMGTHGRTGLSRLMFGSVTESVMRFATVPVIAVNSAAVATGRVGKVLCPVTFTPACRDALRHAAALVNGIETPLVLFRPVGKADAHMGMQSLMQLQQWVPPELVGRCEMKLMSAADDAGEIVRVANATGADLIAIGVPAGRSVHDSLRGTLAERVVRQSACAVLSVNAYAVGVLPPATAMVETGRELVTAG